MDMIISGIIALAVSVLLIAGPKLNLSFLAPLKLEKHQTASKLLVGFLSGLMVFALLTPMISGFGQRLSIIFFSSLLIFANLFLNASPGHEESVK